jgi:hypothetical protein
MCRKRQAGLTEPRGTFVFIHPETINDFCWLIMAMKLVILLGPLAVGNMAVGQEFGKITNLTLFHNHMM